MEKSEAIQTEKSAPPWERPGCFRMDCAAHRGDFLAQIGSAAFFLGLVALVPICGLPAGLLGLSLGLCGRHLAKADLAKMRQGLMDLAGQSATSRAAGLCTLGLGFSSAGTLVWVCLYFFCWWITGKVPLLP